MNPTPPQGALLGDVLPASLCLPAGARCPLFPPLAAGMPTATGDGRRALLGCRRRKSRVWPGVADRGPGLPRGHVVSASASAINWVVGGGGWWVAQRKAAGVPEAGRAIRGPPGFRRRGGAPVWIPIGTRHRAWPRCKKQAATSTC
jgi:hypothetical protein